MRSASDPAASTIGMTMPLTSMSRMNPALATARVISARSVPAINKPSDANAVVASATAGSASATSKPSGDQPSASEPSTITTAWIAITDKHAGDLRGDEPWPAERRRAEALEDEVGPLEPGRDREAR